MVHPHSLRIPRVRRYSGYCQRILYFAYRAITVSGLTSHSIRLYPMLLYAVLTPNLLLNLVWPLSLSLATTHKISVDFFSSPYLDVSVREVPHINLWIQLMLTTVASSRVSPFGHPWLYRLFAPYRGLSQLVTSFFGS